MKAIKNKLYRVRELLYRDKALISKFEKQKKSAATACQDAQNEIKKLKEALATAEK